MPFKSPKDTVGADRCCRLCQGKPDVWLVTNLGVFGRGVYSLWWAVGHCGW